MANNKIKVWWIAAIFFGGAFLGFKFNTLSSQDNISDAFRKLSYVMELTYKFYVDDVNLSELTEAAIKGMFEKLDPHTTYIPPKQLERVEEEFKGEFEGVGIEFQILNDTLTVVTPITGGPSETVGIMPGDRIVKINNESAIGIKTDDVRKKLRGPKGTTVNVSVYRPPLKNLIDFTITRDKIPLYSVDTYFMYDNETGYISVSRFSETTYNEVIKALQELKAKGMKKLIFDLRNNPGGYMNQAINIADLFLSDDKLVVFTKGRRSEFNEEYNCSMPSEFENIPLLILVNNGSASASEIVSGAIQDWDRGIIVGEKTFGKGLVQRQFTLNDNSAVRITISRYYTPTGRSIQKDYSDKKSYYKVNKDDIDEEEVDNFDHHKDKEAKKDLPKYQTKILKRTVYGGGGITPDYIIPNDTLTSLTVDLIRNNIFYSFVRSYLDANGNNIRNEFTTIQRFKNNFNINREIEKEFISYAKNKNIKFDDNKYKIDREYILTRIKAQIARDIWKNEGWYYIILENDKQFVKSLDLFGKAKDLLAKTNKKK
ncbi:MAG TPA: S41 family peptidase [Ignavibacteriales bacterium]|nr:S41 family peptidase [Ignavibacteriales bacterium]HOL80623.1 S41 family peptidase [Ignavibacteriales bacterium]HOM64311.1 S41 family peptidase [Ignavibacteriales bacterium]HPP33043.1 S41 family peptidase [Ignavibacteriales bacterium]HRR18315.1 S41 family peptidase [Ignavibacteriales bacterium]